MKIGIITRHLDLPVGFGTYANNLLAALAEIDRQNQYVIYTPHRPQRRRWPTNFSFRNFGLPQRRSTLARWEHFAAPRQAKRDSVDLIHYFHTACPIPPTGRPVLTNLLDAIDWVMPEYRLPRAYDWLAQRDVRFASHLLTISKHAKRDIQRLRKIPGRKISVTYLAGSPVEARAVRKQAYLLFIGGTEKRKNLRTVLEAFAQADSPGLALRVVGPTNPSPVHDDIDELRTLLSPRQRRRVQWLGRVSDRQMATLYRRALALVYPSLYEGFGIPVLEAMARHTPVITSNTSSLPEVAGDAALLVNPTDAGALARAIRRLAGNARLRQRLVRRGLTQCQKFSWEQTAGQTRKLYQELVK